MLKKLAFGGLGLTFLVSPLLVSPQSASAMDKCISADNYVICQLLEQIANLQAQIAALREQQSAPGSATGGTSQCLDLKNALVFGSTDAKTNGEVSRLQCFLKANGYFSDAQCTGYYGEKTAAAVVRWQKAHGMDFVTLKSGVGPMTRGKMACSSKNIATTTCVNGPVQTTEGLREGVPVITSISPVSGPKGTKVTLTGCNLSGFEGDHNVDLESESGGKVRIVGAGTYQLGRGERGTFIEFTIKEPCQKGETVYGAYSDIPSMCNFVELVPRKYKVSTTPWGEKSNAVNFTVTER